MTEFQRPSAVEKFSGGLPLQATLTAISAISGAPLAALLPVLANTLAAQRQKQRVETTLQDIIAVLNAHDYQLKQLTDQQYKFIYEAILTLLHTTNVEKMKLLREVVHNSLFAPSFSDQEAIFLSRVIRDISVAEALFVLKNFSCEKICLIDKTEDLNIPPQTLPVNRNSTDGQAVAGLLSLGLVVAAEPMLDDLGSLRFSPMAAKLLVLLKTDKRPESFVA